MAILNPPRDPVEWQRAGKGPNGLIWLVAKSNVEILKECVARIEKATAPDFAAIDKMEAVLRRIRARWTPRPEKKTKDLRLADAEREKLFRFAPVLRRVPMPKRYPAPVRSVWQGLCGRREKGRLAEFVARARKRVLKSGGTASEILSLIDQGEFSTIADERWFWKLFLLFAPFSGRKLQYRSRKPGKNWVPLKKWKGTFKKGTFRRPGRPVTPPVLPRDDA